MAVKIVVKNREKNIDVLKAVCAFLVVYIHTPIPTEIGAYITTLARIAVPIFFMITGFFYEDILVREKEITQIKKIVVLFLKANLVFFIWNVFCSSLEGNDLNVFFTNIFTIKNFIKLIFFNESPFAGHLWYLGAILYVLIIVFLLKKAGINKILYSTTIPLLLLDLIFGKYSVVIWGREFPYIIVRNFCFVGIPYFCIGNIVRKYKNKVLDVLNKKTLIVLGIVFMWTSFFERYILITMGVNAERDHYISTTLLSVVAFLYTLFISDKRFSFLELVGKKYTMWIYIIHPIFINIFDVIANRMGIYYVYRFIAPIVVYIGSLSFLQLVEFGKMYLEQCKYTE